MLCDAFPLCVWILTGEPFSLRVIDASLVLRICVKTRIHKLRIQYYDVKRTSCAYNPVSIICITMMYAHLIHDYRCIKSTLQMKGKGNLERIILFINCQKAAYKQFCKIVHLGGCTQVLLKAQGSTF